MAALMFCTTMQQPQYGLAMPTGGTSIPKLEGFISFA